MTQKNKADSPQKREANLRLSGTGKCCCGKPPKSAGKERRPARGDNKG